MAEVKRGMAKHEERYRLKSPGNLVGGKIVLAKYEGDQMWHRAVVISLLNIDEVNIMSESNYLRVCFPCVFCFTRSH